MKKPLLLCILDGWGYRVEKEDNAIALANTPNWNRLIEQYPHSFLTTCGFDVGLPEGQMGNSEVGHMNLGAGRVVMQDLPRIDLAIKDGSLRQNPKLQDFIAKLKASKGRAHVMGLFSPGGVHAHQDHIITLAHYISEAGVPVLLHLFTDGRDTPPQSAITYINHLLREMANFKNTAIATIGGRYFAMDRDKRWERVQLAYETLVEGKGLRAKDGISAIEDSYARIEHDEFIKPAVIGGYEGMVDGDGILCANFRADRVRQILAALLDPDFIPFPRKNVIHFAATLGMAEYSEHLNTFMPALFPAQELNDIFGELIAKAGLTQLRIAETEKYPHVTFFFNGGEEKTYPGEERILIPSPKVATYDVKPEMSAIELTDQLVRAIESGKFDVIIANYANPDMVGHTGVLSAAVKAVETVDSCIGRVINALEKAGGAALITADHGNAEIMRDPLTSAPHTSHTLNPVQIILANGPKNIRLNNGRLADVAPTLLALLKLPQPKAMTGHSLLSHE